MKVDIIVPVYNEERRIEAGIRKLHSFLSSGFKLPWRIIIAENGSDDRTPQLARSLSEELGGISLFRIEGRGRGRALKKAILSSDADIVCYMDIDMSTDLKHLPQLVNAIMEGSHIAIGSRLIKGSEVSRSLKREIFSRLYNLFLRVLFRVKFKDAQCGFKAFNREAVVEILPEVKNNGWFFDSELLIISERKGYSIKEIPVRWEENRDSKVNVLRTAWEDIKESLKLRLRLWKGGIR